jgi:hypothetical protein
MAATQSLLAISSTGSCKMEPRSQDQERTDRASPNPPSVPPAVVTGPSGRAGCGKLRGWSLASAILGTR